MRFTHPNIAIFTIISCIANIALLLIFNEKSYLSLPIIYGLGLFFFTPLRFHEILLLLLIFILPFEHGLRGWQFTVVPGGPEWWNRGYFFYFGLSLRIYLSTLLLFFFSTIKKNTLLTRHSTYYTVVAVFIILLTVSSIINPNLVLAFIGVLQWLTPLTLIITLPIFLNLNPKLKNYILISLMCSFFIQTLIGSYHTFFQKRLGLMLEETGSQTGFVTTDGAPFYRSSGLMGHPTTFGSYLVMLLPLSIYLYRTSIFALVPIITGLISLYGTFSRSAWISLVLVAAFFIKKIPKIIYIPILIIGCIVLTNIVVRISSLSSFLSSGNGPGRFELIKSAKQIVFSKPLFGTGPNQFTKAVYDNGLNDITKGFLYPVHNTWALIAAEIGLPALICIIYLIFLSLQQRQKKSPLTPFLLAGIVGFILNSQVHPLYNQDPTLSYFFILLNLL